MNIVIIPARGSSKRIKNKNLKLFLGKPIIQWTIENLKKYEFINKIIVSTDSKKIADFSKKIGADVPFIRPKKISTDHATTSEVMKHAVDNIKFKANYVCCVYPTSVFINKKDLKSGYEKIRKNNYDYVFSVTESNKPIEKFFQIKKNKIILNNSKFEKSRTQDLNKYYFDAGQFYWGKIGSWKNSKNIFSSKSYPINISNWKTHDIDTMNDWDKAEKLMQIIINENNKNNQNEYLKILNKIEKIRSKNNVNWMDILRVAFKNSPDESKKILLNINEHDDNISDLLKDLKKK